MFGKSSIEMAGVDVWCLSFLSAGQMTQKCMHKYRHSSQLTDGPLVNQHGIAIVLLQMETTCYMPLITTFNGIPHSPFGFPYVFSSFKRLSFE